MLNDKPDYKMKRWQNSQITKAIMISQCSGKRPGKVFCNSCYNKKKDPEAGNFRILLLANTLLKRLY